MESPSGDCTAGWYCTGRSYEREPTAPANSTDLADCVCPAANYSGGKCWPGTYCPVGSAYPTDCDEGMYCDVSENFKFNLFVPLRPHRFFTI